MTIIEIRPFRNGWQVYESAGLQPVFLTQEDAAEYATGRICLCSGEIRILDSSGAVKRIIPFRKRIVIAPLFAQVKGTTGRHRG